MFYHSISRALAIACLLTIFSLTFIASDHRRDFPMTEALLAADGVMSGIEQSLRVPSASLKADRPDNRSTCPVSVKTEEV